MVFLNTSRAAWCLTLLIVASGCSAATTQPDYRSQDAADAGVSSDVSVQSDVDYFDSDSPDVEPLVASTADDFVECPPGRPMATVERFSRPEPFVKPTLEEPIEGRNYDFILGERPSSRTTTISTLGFRPPVASVDAAAVFAEYGETLHVQFRMKTGDVRMDTILVSVLLDYEPHTVEFRRMAPDRSEIVDRVVASEHRFEVDQEANGVLVDFVLLPEAFPEKRMYELSVQGVATRQDETYTFDALTSRRASVFYGGYDIPEHPCFDPGEYVSVGSASSREAEIRPPGWSGAIVTPGVDSWEDTRAGVNLSPSETHLDAELYLYSEDTTRPSVFVPYINDEPWMEGALWISEFGTTRDLLVNKVPVEIPIPEESGRHRVVYHEWTDVYLPNVLLDGERVRHPASVFRGTLPLEVRRP